MRARLRGRVVCERIDVGSKSEREAILLEAEEGSYVLRLRGRRAFADRSLEHLVGARITAEGDLHAQYFDVTDWAVDDE